MLTVIIAADICLMLLLGIFEEAHAYSELPEPVDFDAVFIEADHEHQKTAIPIDLRDPVAEVIIGEYAPIAHNETKLETPEYRHDEYNATLPPLPQQSFYLKEDVKGTELWSLPKHEGEVAAFRSANKDVYIDRRISVYRNPNVNVMNNSKALVKINQTKFRKTGNEHFVFDPARVPDVKKMFNLKNK